MREELSRLLDRPRNVQDRYYVPKYHGNKICSCCIVMYSYSHHQSIAELLSLIMGSELTSIWSISVLILPE